MYRIYHLIKFLASKVCIGINNVDNGATIACVHCAHYMYKTSLASGYLIFNNLALSLYVLYGLLIVYTNAWYIMMSLCVVI